jgi:CubicO group peptidase (beta-lactamase class C family)
MPFYLLTTRPSELINAIGRSEYASVKDQVIYSDLNFILLQAVVERISGNTLDELAASQIFGPLGLKSTCFNPDHGVRERIAASEFGNRYERQVCIDKGYFSPDGETDDIFRSDVIWGEVHDGNAKFMGGVAGHAGLFSTVYDTYVIARQFLPGSSILSDETCDLFRTNFSTRSNEDRSFAFQLASTLVSTAGKRMSLESFGHTGFTGTSLWIDPINRRIFILFTNRTHRRHLPFVNINSIRRRFHDLAIDQLNRNN